jgi:hypothetical protein
LRTFAAAAAQLDTALHEARDQRAAVAADFGPIVAGSRLL